MTTGVRWECEVTKRVESATVARQKSPKKEVKVPMFGQYLKSRREESRPGRSAPSVEAVARQLRAADITVDDTTLRGYEYGWVDKPDPVVLLGLAQIYKTDIHLFIAVLAANRLKFDLSPFELERVLRDAADRSHVETAAAARLAEVNQRLRQIGLELLEFAAETPESGRSDSLPRDAPSSGTADR